MATTPKEFLVGDASTPSSSTNKRYTVTYTTEAGQTLTTVGMLHKDESAAATWVRRTLFNCGIKLKAGTKIVVAAVATRR